MKKGEYRGHILLDEMLDQQKHGCYLLEISELLGIPYNTVKYHLNPKNRKYVLKKTKEYYHKKKK